VFREMSAHEAIFDIIFIFRRTTRHYSQYLLVRESSFRSAGRTWL
jgi:hypothetical protein